MKQVLRVLLCGVIFSFSGTAHANWLGEVWENIKRESTRFAHDVDRETNGVARDIAAAGVRIVVPGPAGAAAATLIAIAK